MLRFRTKLKHGLAVPLCWETGRRGTAQDNMLKERKHGLRQKKWRLEAGPQGGASRYECISWTCGLNAGGYCDAVCRGLASQIGSIAKVGRRWSNEQGNALKRKAALVDKFMQQMALEN